MAFVIMLVHFNLYLKSLKTAGRRIVKNRLFSHGRQQHSGNLENLVRKHSLSRRSFLNHALWY